MMQRPSFSIYDASAGSGKTYTLVKEYLKIILTSKKEDAYRNILAITFTNKAVHEMKSRIVNSLSEFAKDVPSDKSLNLMRHIEQETGLTSTQIQQKSKQIIRHIIHNYAAFDISTIDKFTHKVIRAFAHDLNLPITFDVSLDTENLLTEAVDALISQAGEDEVLTKLLVDFTMEKTDDDKSWDISREIMDTGRLILNENNRKEILHFEKKSIEEFVQIKKKIRDESKQMERESVALANEAIDLINKHGIEFKSFYSSYVPNHFVKLSAGEIIRHIGHYKYLEEIECKRCSSKTPQGQKDLLDKIADELLEKLRKINAIAEKYMFYQAFLKNITPLSLLNTVNQELTKIQKDQNILSIAQFNKLINDQIQNQPAPFIYERLGEKYRHFFIDEFQDTSEMQWQNLIPLIDNATSAEDLSGERGSLMIVGDPKQSIYRWRGGKAEQFIALGKTHNPFNNPDKQFFTLGKNFRSHSQVIDFNNEFFQLLAAEFTHEDYADLYTNHSRQETNEKTGGFVNISFIPKVETSTENPEEDPTKAELYVDATLKVIREVLSLGFDYKDIAILTRKRDHGIEVANHLTQQNIPILSSETLVIANATEVRFIVNILKYLKNSNDLEAKAFFLLYLGNEIQQQMPVHDFVALGMAHHDEKAFELWLEEYINATGLSFRNIRKRSLYETVEILISSFIPQHAGNAYLQFFLDIILERDVKNQSGIADFLDFWDRNSSKFSIPSPEGSNAVRIMTIHKSKGLEFPVVIFPFAEEDYGRKPKDKLWLDSDAEIFGLPKVLIDYSSTVDQFGDEAAAIYLQKKQEELLDNINVLYVALTRAEEQLYIISSMNLTRKEEPPCNCLSAFFIKYLENCGVFDKNILSYSFGSQEKVSMPGKDLPHPIVIEQVKNILDPKAIKIAQRESLMWGTHQQDAIEYGNIIHEILSYIKYASDIPMAIRLGLENGLITDLQKYLVLSTIDEIVNHPELKSYFAQENQILNEQTIIQPEGESVKPDRMVLTADRNMLLLDYKTGSHNQKYLMQLERYQYAIEKMGYRVTKKALVYIGEKVNVVNL